MPLNPAPSSFFGAGYSLASSAISLITATNTTGITVGTTFGCPTDADVLVTASSHNLLVGDRVRVVQGTTLPTGLAAATNYWVKTVPTTATLTLSATRGGATLSVTQATGTSDNLLKSMGPLDEVTDAEANATTGDWRKVLFGIMEMIHYKWLGTPTANRGSKVVVSRTASVNNVTNEITRAYTVRITLSPSAVEVSDE